MDTLEAFGDYRTHAEQVGTLGRPVARRAGAVLLARDDDERHAVRLEAHRRIIDRHCLAMVMRHAAFHAGYHLIPDADIGEGAAHHHVMVAATRAVAVEV